MVGQPRRFISAKKKKELLRKAAQEPVVEEAKKSVKGSLPPPPPPSIRRGEGGLPIRLRPSTLKDLPVPLILEAMLNKQPGYQYPPKQHYGKARLSELHLLLHKAKNPEDKEAVLTALNIYLFKGVEFTNETATKFTRAMLRVGAMTEVVDILLDPSKRLGIWASRNTIHLLLLKLGNEGDIDRMFKVLTLMDGVSDRTPTHRTAHIVVRALINAGQVERAREYAAEAEKSLGSPLREMTKALFPDYVPASDTPLQQMEDDLKADSLEASAPDAERGSANSVGADAAAAAKGGAVGDSADTGVAEGSDVQVAERGGGSAVNDEGQKVNGNVEAHAARG